MAAKEQTPFNLEGEDIFEFDDDEDTDYSDAEPEERESLPEDDSLAGLSPDAPEDLLNLSISDDETEQLFISKDESIVWSSKFPPAGKRRLENIVTVESGVKGPAKEAETCLESWELYFSPDVIEKIVDYTNEKLTTIRGNYQRAVDCSLTDECEIRAFFGLLYLAGLRNLNHVEIHDLWKTNGASPDYFRATMREYRFKLLLRALRFDEGITRLERRKTDKMAPIRQFWDDFNEKCLKLYSPGPNVTIDEMIAAFRGRCSFKQYIPSKPDKYGLKIFAMVDSESCSTELYVGQHPGTERAVSNKPYDVVKRVCASALDTGRNITRDNWFSSIQLIINLLENHRTTVVCTVRKNKREIPPAFLVVRNREPCSALFGYYRKMTMVSYISDNKKKTCTVLISSMHSGTCIDPETGDKKKPTIITYYNGSKGAVDTVDQMKGKFNVSRASRRWLLTLFFTIMNIVMINAVIIHNCNSTIKIKRKDFIQTVALELTKPLLAIRAEKFQILSRVRQLARKYLGLPEEGAPRAQNKTKGICAYDSAHKNRKTNTEYVSCSQLMCGEHTIKICTPCYKRVIMVEDDDGA